MTSVKVNVQTIKGHNSSLKINLYQIICICVFVFYVCINLILFSPMLCRF